MILKNLTFKDIFVFLFTPLLFVSDLIVAGIFQNVSELSFIYLNRYLLFIIVLLIVFYALILKDVIKKFLLEKYIWVKTFLLFIFVGLFTYYVSTFMHPIVEGIFFLNILAVSIGVNIILSLLISGCLNYAISIKK